VIARVAVLLAVASLATAGSVGATERPGTIESRIAAIAPGEDVQALGTTPDGRIVVAGMVRPGYAARAFVRAYLPGGWADPSFGTAGEVSFDSERWVGDMAISPDGRILLAFATPKPRLVRLNPDGGRDTSFGSGGVVDVDLGAAPFLAGLGLYPDGRIVAVGTLPSGDGDTVAVRRLLPNGSPDSSFGEDGRVDLRTPPATYASPAVQPDGGIVLVGGNTVPWIARLSASGQLDSRFGRGGAAPLAIGRARWLSRVGVPYGFSWRPLVLPGGRIRIPVGFGAREHGSRLGVVGLTAGGDVDHRFGRDGLALGPRPVMASRDEWPRTAVRDRSGSILVAGITARGDALNADDGSVVRRFRPDGTLDRSFGRRGLFRSSDGSSETLEQELAIFDDDSVVFGEESAITRYQQWEGGTVYTLDAGYDRAEPAISLRSGCHWMRVRIRDSSALERVVVRFDRRVVRRTTRKNLRLRIRPGLRVSVTAVDVAGNPARVSTTVPPC
jgi:uncharacterized delta-60 repeat protein